MTPSTLYVKRGRKYVAVSDYDRRVFDAMPWGAHLVIAAAGKVTTRYGVNPFHAGLWAAFEAHRDEIAGWLVEAGRPTERSGFRSWPAAGTVVDKLLERLLKAKVEEDNGRTLRCEWKRGSDGWWKNCGTRVSSGIERYCADCGRPVKAKEAKGKR